MWFGYLNRNAEEDLDVPVGPDNNVDNGNPDQGQPTHFYAGRRWCVFKVIVPKDWPVEKRLVWTLTNRGRTNQSKGWLQPEWEIDKLLISANAAGDRFLMSLGRQVSESIIAGNTVLIGELLGAGLLHEDVVGRIITAQGVKPRPMELNSSMWMI